MVEISRTQLRWTACVAILFLFRLAVYHCIRNPVFSNSNVPKSQAKTVFNFTDFFHDRTLYIFGDSTVAAEYFEMTKYPYGIDFKYPDGTNFRERPPTGRFSNGYSIADYIAMRMGSPIPRAFDGLPKEEQDPFRRIKKKKKEEQEGRVSTAGINFASHKCPILSRNQNVKRWTFGEQVIHYYLYRFDPARVGRSLFFISVGRDDHIVRREEESYSQESKYTEDLIAQFMSYLWILYDRGARTFLINNVGRLGCFPDRRDISTKKCDETLNYRVQLYNLELEKALFMFTKKYEEASVLIADSFQLSTQILEDPSKFGFGVVDSPCCGVWAPDKNMYVCKERDKFCFDRRHYLFFDGVHTVDEANRIFVESCLSGEIKSSKSTFEGQTRYGWWVANAQMGDYQISPSA